MRRVKRRVVRDFAEHEIGRFARLIRKILGKYDQKAPNLLIFFEDLRKVFPRLRMRIVEDTDLPDAEAQAYPTYWIIKVRRGVYEGLRRGDRGARWTFAHELGHILLQHPGRPHRKRSAAGDKLVEQQAHIFAAQLLAPSDMAQEYVSVETLASAFQLSHEAARRRLSEIRREERSQSIGSRRPPVERVDTSKIEDLAALICAATSSTISENDSIVTSIERMRSLDPT